MSLIDRMDELIWVTPLCKQGQIVTYSYAAEPSEGVYMRKYDRSDRSVEFYFAPWSEFEANGEYVDLPNHAPAPITAWQRLTDTGVASW